MKSRARDQNGATLPLVALALLLLMGMAAMVVDIGNGRQIRRGAQSAVDAAALAAVIDYNGSPATQPASTLRAIEYVEDNGFTDLATNIIVSFSTNAAGEPCVTVEIRDYPVATFFGRVLGATSLPVTAVSMGCQTPSTTTIPGLFAGGEQCSGPGKAFVTGGNDNRMEGSIHSNLDVLSSGNPNVRVPGTTATWVSLPFFVSGSPTWWDDPGESGPVAPISPWPLTFNIANYRSTGANAIAAGSNYFPIPGDLIRSNVQLNSGIYYVSGKIELTGVTIGTYNGHNGATFVTESGVLELKGNNVIKPFDMETQKLTFFAGWDEGGPIVGRCDSEPMKVSGNCNQFDGVVYVPKGKYTASGEGNGHDYNTGSGQCTPIQSRQLTHAGGVLAWAINVNGNFNLYRGGNVPSGQGTPYLSS